MRAEILQVVSDHARLSVAAESIESDTDLYQAGMTSHASVNLMLALEDRFDVEFPDAMLTRSMFETVANIEAALIQLRSQSPVS